MRYQDEISILKLVRDTCYQQIEVKKAMTVAIQSMEKLQEYEKLGTLEEVSEAVKKQILKKPDEKSSTEKTHYKCPVCGNIMLTVYADGYRLGNEPKYCEDCGQAIDWSNV